MSKSNHGPVQTSLAPSPPLTVSTLESLGADQLVVSRAAAQGVDARAAVEEFIPLAAGQGVAAGADGDRVVTATAGDSTGRGSSTQSEAADTSCAPDPAGPTAQSFCRT